MNLMTRKASRGKDSFMFSDEEAHDKIKEIVKLARKVDKSNRDGDNPSYNAITANYDKEYITELIFYTLQSTIRTNEEIKFLAMETRDIRFFKELIQNHGHTYHEMCCKYMTYEFVEKGENVFEYGTIGSKFYIIIKGRIGIVIPIGISKASGEEEKIMKEVKELSQGESFGELALLNKKPRAATITCKEDSYFAVLDKKHFKMILSEIEEKKLEKSINFFQKLDIFRDWTFNQLKVLYLRFSEVVYKTKDKVFQEGDLASEIYFIKTGEFLLAIVSEGEMLGEDDAYNNEKRRYDVRCLSHEGILYKLDKKEFLKKVKLYERSYNMLMKEAREKTERYKERILTLKETKIKLYKHMYDLRRIFDLPINTGNTGNPGNPTGPELASVQPPGSVDEENLKSISNHRKSVSELNRPQSHILPFSKHFSTKEEKVFKDMKRRAEFALFKNIESQIQTVSHNNSVAHVKESFAVNTNMNHTNITGNNNGIQNNFSGFQLNTTHQNLSSLSIGKNQTHTTVSQSLLDLIPQQIGYFSNLQHPSRVNSEVPTPKLDNYEPRSSLTIAVAINPQSNRLKILSTPRRINQRQSFVGLGAPEKSEQSKFQRVKQEAINQEMVDKLSYAISKEEIHEEFEKQKGHIRASVSFVKKLFPTHDFLFRKNKDEGSFQALAKSNQLHQSSSPSVKHLSENFGVKTKQKLSALASPKIADAFREVKNKKFREMLDDI